MKNFEDIKEEFYETYKTNVGVAEVYKNPTRNECREAAKDNFGDHARGFLDLDSDDLYIWSPRIAHASMFVLRKELGSGVVSVYVYKNSVRISIDVKTPMLKSYVDKIKKSKIMKKFFKSNKFAITASSFDLDTSANEKTQKYKDILPYVESEFGAIKFNIRNATDKMYKDIMVSLHTLKGAITMAKAVTA